MVKSVKRCLHWHVISRLIYNPIIDTINLSSGPRDLVLGELPWRVGASERPGSHTWEAAAAEQTSGRRAAGRSVLLVWGGLPARSHVSPPSRLRVPDLCVDMCVWCPFAIWFLLKNNKNVTQENSVCIPPLAPNIFQFLQEMTDVVGFYLKKITLLYIL